MAVSRQRIYRKNVAGTYDTIHLESSSTCILRPDGTNVEQYLNQVALLFTQIISSLSKIEESINTINGKLVIFERDGLQGYYVGPTPPDNTKLLWIDTTSSTGGLKYHNGSAWVHVPVAYT